MTLVKDTARDLVGPVERGLCGRYVLPLRWRPHGPGGTAAPAGPHPDAHLCSFTKSGRTWIAFTVANYLRCAHGLEPPVDFATVWRYVPDVHPVEADRGLAGFAFAGRPEVPLLALSHAPYARSRFHAPVVLLLRDPRAILVSCHRYVTRQMRTADGRPFFEGTLLDLVRSRRLGAFALSRWLDTWPAAVERGLVTVTTYERWHAAPERELEAILRAMGATPVADAVREAVRQSTFERMLASELVVPAAAGYDLDDPDARQVRRGRPDGWREELTAEERAATEAALARLLTRRTRRMLASVGLDPDAA